MQKFKFFILVTMGFALFVNTLPSASSASNKDVIGGSNADLDYVYVDSGKEYDVSDEAAENDGETFTAFGEEEEDTQYLYLGSKSEFSELQFIVEDDLNTENDENNVDITWQYNDGDSWRELDIEENDIEDFTVIGTNTLSFDVPSDWKMSEYEDDNAYWIRARMNEEIEKGAVIEQISVTLYNVELVVTDENGNYLTQLKESNFTVSGTSDSEIYAFDKAGAGTYRFALQSESKNSHYTLITRVDGYYEYAVNIKELDTDVQSFKIQLSIGTGCNAPFVDTSFHWGQLAIDALYCRGIIEGESNAFMVNHTVTRAEFLKMAIMNADINTEKYDDYDVPFRDVDDKDWYYEYVATAYELDLIDNDDFYLPNGDISRVEALTILIRLAGVESSYSSTRFSDVYASDWFASIVRSGTDYDVVEGYPDGTFKPARNLSRAEAAVMIYNAYNAWYQE